MSENNKDNSTNLDLETMTERQLRQIIQDMREAERSRIILQLKEPVWKEILVVKPERDPLDILTEYYLNLEKRVKELEKRVLPPDRGF